MSHSRRPPVAWIALPIICLLPALPGCGKKGPPLAPLRVLPAPVADLSARRLGSTVYLRFTVPAKNQDGSSPADIDRIELYGFTGRPVDANGKPLDERVFRKYATRVATVGVRLPPPPESEDKKTPARPAPPKPDDGKVEQGWIVSVTETLVPEAMRPVVVDIGRKSGKATPAREEDSTFDRPLAGPEVEGPLLRTYMAFPVSRREQYGRSGRPRISLADPPAPPSAPSLKHTETAIVVEWPLGPGLRRRIQEPAAPELLASKPVFAQLEPHLFNVYDAAASPPGGGTPAPLNAKPLEAPPFEDPRVEFGVGRCYVVRTVEAFADLLVESEASVPGCITPTDIFPPAAPKGLVAVGSEGSISLIWEPNTEKDLAGYLILRGEAPGEKLQALTPAPIRETTYRDTGVRPGVRYVYVVVAVDTSNPPNRSAQSNRAEESAR